MFALGAQLTSQRHSDQVRIVQDVRGDKVVEVPRCPHDVHSKMHGVLFLCESLGSWTSLEQFELFSTVPLLTYTFHASVEGLVVFVCAIVLGARDLVTESDVDTLFCSRP